MTDCKHKFDKGYCILCGLAWPEFFETELQQANEKEEIASRAYAEEYATHARLKKAAKALLKWHDVEGVKNCKEEVEALQEALEDEK